MKNEVVTPSIKNTSDARDPATVSFTANQRQVGEFHTLIYYSHLGAHMTSLVHFLFRFRYEGMCMYL